MSIYSIRDLEKISGIKAHTIRIWERRYKLIEPKRTSTNIRFYSDEDLKLILNVSILNQNGLKISKIAELTAAELKDRVLDLCLDSKNSDVQIESLMVAMLELDEAKFSSVLSNSVIKQGFEASVETVLFPFLEKVGVLWQAGTIIPGQEHFISNLIRQKLIVAIDKEMQNAVVSNGHKMVFFLPEHDWHEIGLLYYSLLARKEGFQVLYLGASVPMDDVEDIVSKHCPKVVFTSFVSAIERVDLEFILNELESRVPNIPVCVMGLQIKQQQPLLSKRFKIIGSGDDFKNTISSLM